jgi:chaperonin GroES
MGFNLEPLDDRIVVRPAEEEEMTASGLVIPDTAKERPQQGEVIAVGPGKFEDGQRTPMDVKTGETVIYSKYGGTEWKDRDGTEYLILSARDVLAIVRK